MMPDAGIGPAIPCLGEVCFAQAVINEDEDLHIPHDLHEHKSMLSQWVAILSALLAALAAVVSYQGNQLFHEMTLKKNEAILKKSAASDQWNYYDAVSTKLHIAELKRDLAPPKKAREYAPILAKYEAEKQDIKARAEQFDRESLEADRESKRMGRPHDRLAAAMIYLQIAIAIASITALTQRRWLLGIAILSGISGITAWTSGLMLRPL